jgi:hypothetical protein
MARQRVANPRYFAVRRAGILARVSEAHQDCDAVVRELAERSVAPTRRRLRIGSERFDASELRGYVRARAASTVRSFVRALVLEGRLPLALADEIAARALEHTAHLVVRDILKRPVVSDPVHSALRRAA